MRFAFALAALVFAVDSLPAQSNPAPKDQAAFFGLDKRWKVHITISAEALKALYPAGGTRMGLSQRGRFKYSTGKIEIAGRTFDSVGLRFKGNSSYWSSSGHLKKSFKIDFNRYVEDQHFLGLRKLNLQNNVTDNSQIREAVSYAIYREAGVPACRTAFASVYLTVEGKFQQEYLGNYTIVEQVDRQFLAHRFGDRRGLIVKPEGRVMPYLGDTWDTDYDRAYIPKTKFKKRHSRPMVAMAKLAIGEEATFYREIEQVLDVGEFLNYTAVTTYLVNWDSPFRIPHNFYMAVPEKTQKVLWIPWDLNLSMGGGRRTNGGDVYRAATLPLFTRLMAKPKYRAIYESHLKRLAEGPGSPEAIAALFRQARAMTKDAIAAEADQSEAITRAGNERSGFGFNMLSRGRGNPESIAAGQDRFAKDRAGAVLRTLEAGYQGPGSSSRSRSMFGRGRTARARKPMDALRETLVRSKAIRWRGAETIDSAALTKAATKLFQKFDRDDSGTATRGEILALLRSQRGVDQMPSECRRIVRAIDKDRSRDVSAAELVAAYATGFELWDKDADGKLSRAELALPK